MSATLFRLQSAKLFIEAGLLHECVRTLKTVQQEKDTVAELWYLYCFVYRLMGKEDKVLVRSCPAGRAESRLTMRAGTRFRRPDA